MIATLADLLCPLSQAEFIEVFCARRRLHIKTSDPSRAQSLLPWSVIDTLLSRSILDDNVRLTRDGVLIPRQLYTVNEGQSPNVRVIQDLLIQGVSIVFDEIQRSVPHIRQLATNIERAMGIRTNVNAYFSFSKGGAFKPHWDIMDVLVLQVHGEKRWKIWNAEVQSPVNMSDRAKVNSSVSADQEVQLESGDLLFVPRGEPHAAAVSGRSSVHLTIGMLSHTGIDLISYLRKKAAEDVILRMDLPRHAPRDRIRAHQDAIKHQLHQIIEGTSVAEFLMEGDILRSPVAQVSAAGTFPEMDDVVQLTLRRKIPLPDDFPTHRPDPLTIGGQVFHLSPASVGILRWLFEREVSTVRALSDHLSTRYEQRAIEKALKELVGFGFLLFEQGNQR